MPVTRQDVLGTVRAFAVRPDRIDLRDRPYQPRVDNLPPAHPDADFLSQHLARYLGAGMMLDQGDSDACTGFALAAVVNFQRWRATGYATAERVSPAMLYQLAQLYDEWEGEDYDGSSCRGALKGWHKHGVCGEALWPFGVRFKPPRPGWDADAAQRTLGVYYRIETQDITDLQAAIVEAGAVYVAAQVHRGWELRARRLPTTIAKLPAIPFNPARVRLLGGHAFALVGYTNAGFIVQNSWGTTWAAQGFALLRYEDWLVHAADAWVAGLGVPLPPSKPVRDYVSLVETRSAAPRIEYRGVERTRDRLAERGYWNLLSEADALRHSVLTGNDGRLLHKRPENDDALDQFQRHTIGALRDWLDAQPEDRPKRVLVYVHGGLNSLQDGLNRSRILAPYFLANGIYPLFVNWSSGAGESFLAMLADAFSSARERMPPVAGWLERLREGALDAWDRTLELAMKGPGGALWREMKENAARSADPNNRLGGTRCLAEALNALRGEQARLQLHVVGHSAGAIVIGHWLQRLAALQPSTCTLFAPACTVAFANAMFRQLPRSNLFVHGLSDRRERDDDVGKVYRKSLLYLVSRAFELHKTPLLGLALSFDAATTAQARVDLVPADWHAELAMWQAYFWADRVAPSGFAAAASGLAAVPGGKGAGNLVLLDARQVNAAPGRRIDTAHGAFDNDVDTLNAVLERVLGAAPAQRFVNVWY